MKTPNSVALRIYNIGRIKAISFDYAQTGTDTAETFCKLTGTHGSVKGKWDTYSDFIDYRYDYNSVCRLKSQYVKEIEEFKKFEDDNKKDIDEYNRLKDKLFRS